MIFLISVSVSSEIRSYATATAVPSSLERLIASARSETGTIKLLIIGFASASFLTLAGSPPLNAAPCFTTPLIEGPIYILVKFGFLQFWRFHRPDSRHSAQEFGPGIFPLEYLCHRKIYPVSVGEKPFFQKAH